MNVYYTWKNRALNVVERDHEIYKNICFFIQMATAKTASIQLVPLSASLMRSGTTPCVTCCTWRAHQLTSRPRVMERLGHFRQVQWKFLRCNQIREKANLALRKICPKLQTPPPLFTIETGQSDRSDQTSSPQVLSKRTVHHFREIARRHLCIRSLHPRPEMPEWVLSKIKMGSTGKSLHFTPQSEAEKTSSSLPEVLPNPPFSILRKK